MNYVDKTVIIIGSGFGGQSAAINLQKRGISDFQILERRSFMGGTWCQNSYPGAAVDVQSPLYSLSFEPYPWTQMYAEQKELGEYTEYVIKKHGLRERTATNTNVESVKWNETDKKWEVTTSKGIVYRAQFVINASGPLSTPVVPGFKGKDSFKGKSFHTNDWDHSYDYKGKRVAIIGSGASAAQVVPAIAAEVKELKVFQRSPHWLLPRGDRVFTELQRKLLSFRPIYQLLRSYIYLKLESRVIGMKYSNIIMDKVAGSEARHQLKNQIRDPELRKKLTPDYVIGCKRVIMSSTFLPAMDRDNVSLFDKDEGIKEINENGILTQTGEQVDLDLIVYATGYQATDGVISYPVEGRDGHTIAKKWDDFPRAYLGTTLPDFPNLFLVTGPNTGIGHTSALFIIEAQMNYIMNAIESTRKKKLDSIEVRADAEETYTSMIHSEMERTVWQSGGCSSWYKSASGKVIAMFPGFSFSYYRLSKKVNPSHHTYS